MADKTLQKLTTQYEKFPYPQIPLLALPSLPQAHTLAYEFGQFLRTGYFHQHSKQTRILVAGCGSFEPLLVARAHPKAQITAIDLSLTSLNILKKRFTIARVLSLGKFSTPIKIFQADLHENLKSKLGEFDYILCTGVLHHCSDPTLVLKNLSNLLSPAGILRIMMYAERSRYWIYELQGYFKSHGLTGNERNLLDLCNHLIAKLPPENPLRTSFEQYSDARTLSGLIDGFFHAHEAPIPIESFATMSAAAGLSLAGFGHAWHSQPQGFLSALKEKAPELSLQYAKLSPFEKLAFIDECLELTVNPVFWMAKNLDDVSIIKDLEDAKHIHTHLNPVLKYAKSFFAPLVEPANKDLSVEKLAMADAINPKNKLRMLEGGVLLSNAGSLPLSLFQNREKAFQIMPNNHADRSILGGLKQALNRLSPINPNQLDQWLNLLEPVLEERVSAFDHNVILPGLSAGDLLRNKAHL